MITAYPINFISSGGGGGGTTFPTIVFTNQGVTVNMSWAEVYSLYENEQSANTLPFKIETNGAQGPYVIGSYCEGEDFTDAVGEELFLPEVGTATRGFFFETGDFFGNDGYYHLVEMM